MHTWYSHALSNPHHPRIPGTPICHLNNKKFSKYLLQQISNKTDKKLRLKLYYMFICNKIWHKKVQSSTARTMQPTRPRQCLYADLIPMFKGQFSYILFCLDAYSQYTYAIPLKDKTAPSVFQGFLSLFASSGFYEQIYLDNETSFQSAAKLLIKIAPTKILYSTPYCHFQNSSENYIKNFKKAF